MEFGTWKSGGAIKTTGLDMISPWGVGKNTEG